MLQKHPVGNFLAQNGLSVCLFGLFFIFLMGLSFAGLDQHNQNQREHNQPEVSYGQYVVSGEFIEAIFENWESEFLQMAALVVLTIFLRQRGAADSKKLRGKEPVDTSSRYSIIHAATWATRGKVLVKVLYANSLSIALFGLFVVSFVLHALSGVAAHNQHAMQHGGEQLSVLAYIGTSQFWFESFQNWQSEFLAVASLLVLSVYLRQRGSPESKPVAESNEKTGK